MDLGKVKSTYQNSSFFLKAYFEKTFKGILYNKCFLHYHKVWSAALLSFFSPRHNCFGCLGQHIRGLQDQRLWFNNLGLHLVNCVMKKLAHLTILWGGGYCQYYNNSIGLSLIESFFRSFKSLQNSLNTNIFYVKSYRFFLQKKEKANWQSK